MGLLWLVVQQGPWFLLKCLKVKKQEAEKAELVLSVANRMH